MYAASAMSGLSGASASASVWASGSGSGTETAGLVGLAGDEGGEESAGGGSRDRTTL